MQPEKKIVNYGSFFLFLGQAQGTTKGLKTHTKKSE